MDGLPTMPKISQFFGIAIYMYYDDHAPPHFHARYGGGDSLFEIDSGELLGGEASPRVRRLVTEWAAEHRAELRRQWDLARQKHPLEWIAPLE